MAKKKTKKKASGAKKRTAGKKAAKKKEAKKKKTAKKKAAGKVRTRKKKPGNGNNDSKYANASRETQFCCQDLSELQWNNEDKVEEGTAGSADVELGRYDESAILIAKEFGFEIPPFSTIQGIKVTVTTSAGGEDADDIVNQTLQLSKTSNPSSPSGTVNKATDKQLNDGPIEAGGSNDLWGTTWNADDINSVNFGVLFRAENYSGTQAIGYGYVDKVEVQVWWS